MGSETPNNVGSTYMRRNRGLLSSFSAVIKSALRRSQSVSTVAESADGEHAPSLPDRRAEGHGHDDFPIETVDPACVPDELQVGQDGDRPWTPDETEMLVEACKKWGVGRWMSMLQDPQFRFNGRTAVDLNTRFNVVASTHPDARHRVDELPRNTELPWTDEEDAALRTGHQLHGESWGLIVKYPVFQARRRVPAQLRDRFRAQFAEIVTKISNGDVQSADGISPHALTPVLEDAELSEDIELEERGPLRRRRMFFIQDPGDDELSLDEDQASSSDEELDGHSWSSGSGHMLSRSRCAEGTDIQSSKVGISVSEITAPASPPSARRVCLAAQRTLLSDDRLEGTTLASRDGSYGVPAKARYQSKCSFLSETRSLGGRRSEFSSDGELAEYLPDLTGQIARRSPYPVAGGGYADVWSGAWMSRRGEYDVAIKAIRVFLSDEESDRIAKDKRLRREIKMWMQLDHPNVVPLYGVAYDFGPFAAMVCPWYSQGSLSDYLKRTHHTLSIQERTRLMMDVAQGLDYLHESNIIHGDLTGANILLTSEETCCLADFGLSILLEEIQGCSASPVRGAVRWSAPELFRLDWDRKSPRRSTCNDIFSFGSVLLQIMSGKHPYFSDNDFGAVAKLATGVLPDVPPGTHLPQRYEELMACCWTSSPEQRPTSDQVISYLHHLQDFASWPNRAVSCTQFWTLKRQASSAPSIVKRNSSSGHTHPLSYRSSPSLSRSSRTREEGRMP